MDYKKAYEEALERAKRWADGTLQPERTTPQGVCETIFPELAESEDERIRKAIIELLKEFGRDDTGIGENTKCMIAWLEKKKEPENTSASTMIPSCWEEEQKEQKPAEWSDEDEKFFALLRSGLYNMKWRIGCVEYDKAIERLKSLRLQQNAEWSAEDEKMRNNILRVLSCFEGTVECESIPSLSTSWPTYMREIEWLKSLRLQQNAQWSDEDEHKIRSLIRLVEDVWRPDEVMIDYVGWLRSLRNRYAWKPSEEQIRALKYVAYHLMPDENYRDEMFLLYEQLKKLMEED